MCGLIRHMNLDLKAIVLKDFLRVKSVLVFRLLKQPYACFLMSFLDV